jgi:hypothetical protein
MLSIEMKILELVALMDAVPSLRADELLRSSGAAFFILWSIFHQLMETL